MWILISLFVCLHDYYGLAMVWVMWDFNESLLGVFLNTRK